MNSRQPIPIIRLDDRLEGTCPCALYRRIPLGEATKAQVGIEWMTGSRDEPSTKRPFVLARVGWTWTARPYD